MARVLDLFSSGSIADRLSGDSTPPIPPPRGGGRGVESHPPKPAASERQQWLRENLPTVAAVVDDFAAVFGRDQVKVAYADEAGHVIGKPSPDGVKLSEMQIGRMFASRERAGR